MKILILDRDSATAHLMKSRLEPFGYQVGIREPQGEGIDELTKGTDWDIVFVDPSPRTNLKPMVISMRRANRRSLYMVLCTGTLNERDALSAGFNDILLKPVDMNQLLDMAVNGKNLTDLQRRLSDTNEDFPSAGGVIAKSAFNQLFLSCLDRADRYGERAHILFISIENYAHLVSEIGDYEANAISARLAQHLVRARRQSDIIAQTAKNEYALLLLRPLTESEPIEAANRFAEFLSRCTDLITHPNLPIHLRVTLINLPTGHRGVDHRFALDPTSSSL